MRDSAGVTIVANPATGLWTPETAWRVEEELRIGPTAAGDPAYEFGQVGARGITVAGDGTIFVLDAMAQQVKVFSADGTYQRAIGRPGAGPGEIGPATSFLFLSRGDTLLLPDLQNVRVNWYAMDGGSGSFPLAFQDGIPLSFDATPSGVVTMQLRRIALPEAPATENGDAIVVLSPGGSLADTLRTFASGGTLSGMGGADPEIRLFSAEPVWAIGRDTTLLFGINDDYRLGLHAGDGTLERVITKPMQRAMIQERDHGVFLGSMEEAWKAAGVPPQALPRLRSIVSFAEFYPAYASFYFGPRGSIWVQRIQEASTMSPEDLAYFNILEDFGSDVWDVFDAEGRYLGEMTLPGRFKPRLFRGDVVYGVTRDAFDLQSVVRMRVVVPAAQPNAS